jgi:hypothetical protein
MNGGPIAAPPVSDSLRRGGFYFLTGGVTGGCSSHQSIAA